MLSRNTKINITDQLLTELQSITALAGYKIF
jgi:hypothetical protein